MHMRLSAAGLLALTACSTDENLKTRHGSPLHTYTCEGGKSFQARQVMTGEVEVTAGGQTRDVTNADGDPVPNGPRMIPIAEATRLTGMPGGPYEGCLMNDGDAG